MFNIFGFSRLAAIKVPISEEAKAWLAKMKRDGKFWITELIKMEGK